MRTTALTRGNERGLFAARLRHDGPPHPPTALIGGPRGERGAVSDR
jgi:hypothetical protein